MVTNFQLIYVTACAVRRQESAETTVQTKPGIIIKYKLYSNKIEHPRTAVTLHVSGV